MAIQLTERRKQFLRGVLDIYWRTQLPVHYEALAERLGVSKWTAYDVMCALEKQGLLTRDYTVSRGEPGRSQIVFVPTPAAEALFAQLRPVPLDADALAALKAEALRSFREWRSLSPEHATERIMAVIADAGVQVRFCTYVMALCLVHLCRLQERAVAVVRQMVRQAPGVETQLSVFVGILAGMLIEEVQDGVGEPLVGLLVRFLKSLVELADAEKRMLVSFLDDALAEVGRRT